MPLEPCPKDTLLRVYYLGTGSVWKVTARIDTAFFDISPKVLCPGITNILSQVL